MRSFLRLFAALLCACLLLCPARAEEENREAAFLSSLPLPEGHTLISPLSPIPDFVLDLIETARGELGYTEERSGVTKYGLWAGYPEAQWCAEFQCWCVYQTDRRCGTALLNRVYPNYSGTNVGRDWYLSAGRYVSRTGTVPGWGTQWWKDTDSRVEPNSYVPQPGDWMFLTDNSEGDTCHVALVECCSQDGAGQAWVHVIEGNNVLKPAPQSVERNTYALTHWQILGYGTVRDLADITLRFGCSGEKVRALQAELAQSGLLDAQYVTGRYGDITTGVIKAFQQRCGILETGVANLETRLALRALAEN